MKVFKEHFLNDGWSVDEDFMKEYAFDLSKITGELSEEKASLIYKYMMSWPIFSEWLSPIRDPLNSKIKIPNSERSDGVYVWNEMHCHLVKTYHIGLPIGFLEHVNDQMVNNVKPTKESLGEIQKWYDEEMSRIQSKLGGRSLLRYALEHSKKEELVIDFDRLLEEHQ